MATALWKAVKEADVEQLEQLIKSPSEANVFNKKGETPLILAVQNGKFTSTFSWKFLLAEKNLSEFY